MEFNETRVLFDKEDRWITGLPESLPIDAVGVAFGITRRARSHCYNRFYELVMACDVEALTDEDVNSLALYADRLGQLDRLSQRFVPVLMPRIINTLEQTQAG